uniref:Uncharacterized protein n=1 Tax=Nelumbo nucifera TaxID=4432 RepID=A0A822ZQU8_NELNU|nr:TPA_asm: hypothetical protein HUJ06_004111 [Nelumbo nucifera]
MPSLLHSFLTIDASGPVDIDDLQLRLIQLEELTPKELLDDEISLESSLLLLHLFIFLNIPGFLLTHPILLIEISVETLSNSFPSLDDD